MLRKYIGMFVLGLMASPCLAQNLETLSDSDLATLCERATQEKPFMVSSAVVQSGKLHTAQTVVHCWKDNDRTFALSELVLDGKKVYTTPPEALNLESSCGIAAGEVYRPQSFSPDGNYFAFLLVPFCRETEPLAPVVMLSRCSNKKTKAPDFTPIAKEIFKRYPKTKANKRDLDFVSSIVGWAEEKLLIDVNVVCYGCFDQGKLLSFPKTRWAIAPNEKISFVSEQP